MASLGYRLCANCIGAVSFRITVRKYHAYIHGSDLHVAAVSRRQDRCLTAIYIHKLPASEAERILSPPFPAALTLHATQNGFLRTSRMPLYDTILDIHY